MKTVSIVIPCHNEENAIHTVIDKILEQKKIVSYINEIIVVDDGSTDMSSTILNEYKHDIKVLKNSKALGYGGALKVGFQCAKSDLTLFLDMDDTYDIIDLPKMYQILNDNNLDIIFGNRLKNDNGMPLIRKIGNNMYRGCLKLLGYGSLSDPCTGMRLFKTELAKSFCKLKQDDLSFSMSLSMLILKNNLRFSEVNINYHERIGESKLNPAIDGVKFFWAIMTSRKSAL